MFSDWWSHFLLDVREVLAARGLDRLLPEPQNMVHPVVWMGAEGGAYSRLSAFRLSGSPAAMK